jgi:Na+-transporting NADH:ubiquinone oxidoreductase subunit NqrD
LNNASLSILQSSRREARIVVGLWLASCAWVVGYALAFAYRQEPPPQLIAGIPSWVVWGVLAPWAACLAATIWMSFWGIRDEVLEEAVHDPHGSDANG